MVLVVFICYFEGVIQYYIWNGIYSISIWQIPAISNPANGKKDG